MDISTILRATLKVPPAQIETRASTIDRGIERCVQRSSSKEIDIGTGKHGGP